MRKNILSLNKKGRYFLGFGIALMMISTVFSTIALADEDSDMYKLNYQFSFEKPLLSSTTLLNEGFTSLDVDGCMPMGYEVGSPIIPVKFINLLLPPGKTVSDIHYSGNFMKMDSTNFDLTENPVEPYQKPVTFNDPLPTELDFSHEAYTSNQEFPSKPVINQGESMCRGYTILSLAISPVSYIPGKGELQYCTEISIDLMLEDTNEINKFYRNDYNDKMWVETLVSNPEMTDYYQFDALPSFDYPGGLCDPADDYDYVIMTISFHFPDPLLLTSDF